MTDDGEIDMDALSYDDALENADRWTGHGTGCEIEESAFMASTALAIVFGISKERAMDDLMEFRRRKAKG